MSKPPRVLKHAFNSSYNPMSIINIGHDLCTCGLPPSSEVHFDIETQEEYQARTAPIPYHEHFPPDAPPWEGPHDHQGRWREHTHPMSKPDLPEPDRRLFDTTEGREPRP